MNIINSIPRRTKVYLGNGKSYGAGTKTRTCLIARSLDLQTRYVAVRELTDRQTDRQTHRTTTVTLRRMRRGLINDESVSCRGSYEGMLP